MNEDPKSWACDNCSPHEHVPKLEFVEEIRRARFSDDVQLRVEIQEVWCSHCGGRAQVLTRKQPDPAFRQLTLGEGQEGVRVESLGPPVVESVLAEIGNALHSEEGVGSECRIEIQLRCGRGHRWYSRISGHLESDPVGPERVQGILCLVLDEYELPELSVIAGWSPETRQACADWAGACHLRASDNDDVEIPEKPEVLK
jgi:hypothetical protein